MRKITAGEALVVPVIVTTTSTALMLLCASPELSWDEADLAAHAANTWSFLWGRSDYVLHLHGPMPTYLARLGRQLFPVGVASPEFRLRFFTALVSSLAIGLSYAALRRAFGASRPAALAAVSLLLFSVIRLEETNIIGPHDPMLACTLAIMTLGFWWRDKPGWRAALGLGSVMALGALSMTYVIPAGLCWVVAMFAAGRGWFARERIRAGMPWPILAVPATAAILVLVVWPPGLLQNRIWIDFWENVRFPHHPALVGDRIFEVTPRSAVLYWLARLDAPILLVSISIIFLASWRALRSGRISSKHAYLGIFLVFFLATMLAAHLAGARNLLQFIGVMCVATGALFDEALGERRVLVRVGSAAVILLAAFNLVWLSRGARYTPSLATDGYGAFLRENEHRLRERARAVVYGVPILQFYSLQEEAWFTWDITEMPWTTGVGPEAIDGVRYVLMPAFVPDGMPADQPMRRVVAAHWKIAWSHTANRAWDLRLYENPLATAP